MAYKQKDIDKALLAYLQCRTVEGAAKIAGFPPSTVRKWWVRYNWEKELEKHKAEVALAPLDPNKQLEEYIEGFNITEEDADALRHIKTIEGVCFACMFDDVPQDKIFLRPKTFKEATDVLLKCLQAREALLHRDKKASMTFNGPTKVDFITQERDENSANQGRQILPGSD